MTDAELLLRVQRGDLAAWEPLYARCFPTVWRHACALVQDVSEAEEVASETLLAFVRNLQGLDSEAVHLHGWLRGVVRHKAADRRRQSAKQRRLMAAARNGSGGGNDSSEVPSELEVQEARQDVLAALDRLPEIQRLVLEWKHAEEQTVREISMRLGQTEKSVESLLYRARKEFRRVYELERADNLRTNLSTDARGPTLEKSM
ncbi:MAG: RNA polymerase sigma factor [Planctomycetaceae bacterium]